MGPFVTTAAIKLHNVDGLRGALSPSFIHLPDGTGGDATRSTVMDGSDAGSRGDLHLMDRGYLDFARMVGIHPRAQASL